MNSLDFSICWSVSALMQAVSDVLKARFSAVQVRGEVSGFTRASSGHCYFTLKDAGAQIRCVMFQRVASMLDFSPIDGDDVQLHGRLAIYGQRGDLQLVVEAMQSVGQGKLLAQFQLLKNKLEHEGLFEPQRKRSIACYPQVIGVVSSLKAAALHDVLTALKRRVPHVDVRIYPASVQGQAAVTELVNAISLASKRHEVDTLLVCRGGGSLEDLWCFNEEAVVRAIAQCTIPVISGVGHETDFTLADFAADLRAPTPTAAAELCAVPLRDALAQTQDLSVRLSRAVNYMLDNYHQRMDVAGLTLRHQGSVIIAAQSQCMQQADLHLRMAIQQCIARRQNQIAETQRFWPIYVREELARKKVKLDKLVLRWQQQAPFRRLNQSSQKSEGLSTRLQWAVKERLSQLDKQLDQTEHKLTNHFSQKRVEQQTFLENLSVRLLALNPQGVLSRGYAWVTDSRGQVVSSSQKLQPGQQMQAQFADGIVTAQVKQVEPDLLPQQDHSGH